MPYGGHVYLNTQLAKVGTEASEKMYKQWTVCFGAAVCMMVGAAFFFHGLGVAQASPSSRTQRTPSRAQRPLTVVPLRSAHYTFDEKHRAGGPIAGTVFDQLSGLLTSGQRVLLLVPTTTGAAGDGSMPHAADGYMRALNDLRRANRDLEGYRPYIWGDANSAQAFGENHMIPNLRSLHDGMARLFADTGDLKRRLNDWAQRLARGQAAEVTMLTPVDLGLIAGLELGSMHEQQFAPHALYVPNPPKPVLSDPMQADLIVALGDLALGVVNIPDLQGGVYLYYQALETSTRRTAEFLKTELAGR